MQDSPHLLQFANLPAGNGDVALVPHEDLRYPKPNPRPAPCDESHLAAQNVRTVEVPVLLQAVVVVLISSHTRFKSKRNEIQSAALIAPRAQNSTCTNNC